MTKSLTQDPFGTSWSVPTEIKTETGPRMGMYEEVEYRKKSRKFWFIFKVEKSIYSVEVVMVTLHHRKVRKVTL